MTLRRKFLALVAAAMAFVGTQSFAADDYQLKVGMQTWTLRNLNFEQMVEFCSKHKIKYVQLIANHVDPKAPREQQQRKKEVMEKAGLVPYTFGVAGTSLDKEDNRKLFEFAKFMGMKMIIVEPGDYKILDNLEELAKEYDIKVCIHNHDIKSPYGNPAVVRNLIKHRDSRIGVCMDAGWVATTRIDVPKTFKDYNGRVYDIHLKDKKVKGGEKGDTWDDVFIGEGDAKIGELFKVLKENKYDGVVAIETDKNLKDPTEHVVKALEFIEKNKP